MSDRGHEIVDLINPNTKYDLFARNVPRVYSATGGLLQKSPIVCGGTDDNFEIIQDCHVIGQSEMKIKMNTKRDDAASVVLDQSKLWIVGGSNAEDGGVKALRSTEFIKLDQPSAEGPEMQFTIRAHSMIQYDEKSIYIIGGSQNKITSKKTWIIDPTNGFQIKEGPLLQKARKWHGCAKMTIGGRTILVVAGGNEASNSVEILDPSEKDIWFWTPGLCFEIY